jgi:hypothetical protein
MAAEIGKDGFISFGTSSGGASTAPTVASNNLDTWAITPDITLADVTAFGNLGRAFAPTIRGWKATASGTLDMDAGTTGAQYFILQIAQTTGSNLPVWCRFKTLTGAYTGPAVLTQVAVNSKVTDKVSVSYSLTGTSYLQYN